MRERQIEQTKVMEKAYVCELYFIMRKSLLCSNRGYWFLHDDKVVFAVRYIPYICIQYIKFMEEIISTEQFLCWKRTCSVSFF